MADTKVSDLTQITVPSNNDILYIVSDSAGTSNKITYDNLFNTVNTNITTLDGKVNLTDANIQVLSSFYDSLNISNFLTDIEVISANVNTLSTETDDLYVIRGYATRAYNEATILSGGLTRSVNTAGGTLNFINGVLQSVT